MLAKTMEINTLFRYACVGGINTIVCFSVMYGISWIYPHYLIYTTAGYFIAFIVSFFLNYYFTFLARGDIAWRLLKFILISLANLILVTLMQYYLIEQLSWPILQSIIIAAIGYTVIGYLLNKRFVFQPNF